jgi:hypothetical protein
MHVIDNLGEPNKTTSSWPCGSNRVNAGLPLSCFLAFLLSAKHITQTIYFQAAQGWIHIVWCPFIHHYCIGRRRINRIIDIGSLDF